MLSLPGVCGLRAPAAADKVQKPLRAISEWRVLFNDDATNNFFGAIYPLTKSDLEAQVDFLAEKGIDAYAWCTALPDLCHYGTKIGEAVWSPARRAKITSARQWYAIENLRRLIESGHDPVAVLAERCHRHGIAFVASVRMNDSHHSNYRFAFYATNFFLNHPQWAIRNADGAVVGGMDYAVPEVRAHRLAIMREQAENFNIDGLELDFTRWPPHFSPAQAINNTPVLTAYIEEIREMLKRAASTRRRDKLILGARVPATLEECRLNGIDLRTLIGSGIVDYICPSDFIRPDFNIPVESFTALTRESRCRVFPTIFSFASNGYYQVLSLPQYRALAHNFYAGGADGVSTFNIMPGFIRNETYMKLRGNDEFAALREFKEPEKLTAREREYVFYPIGESRFGKLIDRRIVFDRGRDVGTRKAISFRVMENFDHNQWRYHFRFVVASVTPKDKLKFDLNGKLLNPLLKSTIRPGGRAEYHQLMGLPLLTATCEYEMNLSGRWAVRGDNELGAELTQVNEELKDWSVDYLGPQEILKTEPIVILELKVAVKRRARGKLP